MPVNLELKIKLNEPGKFSERIRVIKAEYKGELNQVDVYYKYKSGRLKLRLENGNQTLIKYLRNEGKGKRWSDYRLLSLENNDARDYLKDILEEEVVIEKKRRLYIYNNTRIHIDEVKELGTFLELETLVVNGKRDAGERYKEIIRLLSIKKENEIRKSYRELMLEKIRK